MLNVHKLHSREQGSVQEIAGKKISIVKKYLKLHIIEHMQKGTEAGFGSRIETFHIQSDHL